MASGNKLLGEFNLEGIAPAPRGMPQIEVSFDIDANGILHVGAKDKATGREQKITITAGSGLSKEEVERLVKEAAANEAADKQRREYVEERNKLDNLVHQVDKSLRENKDKLAPDAVASLEAALNDARAALDSDRLEVVREAAGKLEQAAHKLAETMYASGDAGQGGPTAGGPAAGGPNDVIDAEFSES
jgi:molecular chaperone DnaK